MSAVNILLTGTSYHRLDGKNRCHVPQRFRSATGWARDSNVGDVVHSTFFLIPRGNCAYLLTPEQFQHMALEVPGEGLADDDDIVRRQRRFFAQAHQVEVDSQGRITLPPDIVKRVGFDPAPQKTTKGEKPPVREVAIAGCGNRAELWSAERWREESESF